jgi:hypothetical protein
MSLSVIGRSEELNTPAAARSGPLEFIYICISGSGSGLISILQPLLLLPSSYYLCVSPPRQYVNYLTTTVYFRKYLIVLLIKFRSITYLALRPLGAGVIKTVDAR